jgi:hypothetical protein
MPHPTPTTPYTQTSQHIEKPETETAKQNLNTPHRKPYYAKIRRANGLWVLYFGFVYLAFACCDIWFLRLRVVICTGVKI